MTVETLERALLDDLLEVHERFADEKFCHELYRALTRTKLSKRSVSEGHVTLSFNQAEGMINELRGRFGQDDLTLAQTGGEGEVDSTVRDVLTERGWTIAPASTGGGHDPQHDTAASQPPPDGQGQPAGSGDWERQAHAEADREIQRKTP
jgi:hypothetical protein